MEKIFINQLCYVRKSVITVPRFIIMLCISAINWRMKTQLVSKRSKLIFFINLL